MKHKVLGSVFVVAVALGLAGVTLRMKDERPAAPTKTAKPEDPMARPLASYRVQETPIEQGMSIRGAGYSAQVATHGVRFASKTTVVNFGSPRIEQGGLILECDKSGFSRPAFGVARLDRGAVQEEYIFENGRAEQLYRIPAPIAEGALTVRIPTTTNLDGPVVAHGLQSGGMEELQFRNGGLAFCDATGATRFAYYGAVAIDALNRRVPLEPKFENGSIALAVPAEFLANAAYPVVVDPWLDFLGSGSGGGVTGNGSTSQHPVIGMTGGGLPFIVWSDNTSGTYQIYLKYWNGFTFSNLGGSDGGKGLSVTTGNATNPSVVLDGNGDPTVAWEDDSNGAVNIFLKSWKGSWVSLAGSTGGSGINHTFGPALHPSVGLLRAIIPGQVTTDPATNITTSTPAKFLSVPIVCWEDNQTGGQQIYCAAYYPGQPAQPISGPNPLGLLAVPEGWYQLGALNGVGVDSTLFFPGYTASATPLGALSQYPSLVVDQQNRVSIAWQDSRDGNFEIYLARWGGGVFQVASNASLTGFNMLPASNFATVGQSLNVGGISATATPSQYPSLATDSAAGNLTVAWQETEGAAAGTAAQIYLARSTGGAFGGLAGSNGVGGVSQAAAGFSATYPSVDVNGNFVGVVWADNTNGRSSIYGRRFHLTAPVSTQWEQIGFQGSAGQLVGADTTNPLNGISQSLSYSVFPRTKLDVFGDPAVVWADGSAATFDVLAKTFSPNGPGVASGVGTATPAFATTLRQTSTDPTAGGGTDVLVADFSSASQIFLSSRLFTEALLPAGTQMRLEIELQPQNAAFTGTPTHQALYNVPDDPTTTTGLIASIHLDGLPNANYHWQARTSDQIGRQSPWIPFATVSGASFRINATVITPPPGGGGGGGTGPSNSGSVSGSTKHKSGCGLTGLEGVALAGLAALLRRRAKRSVR